MRSAGSLTIVLIATAAGACGKSGPPLPPLVRQPAPPTELAAVRRGDSVDVRFLVPSANTDGSRPANLQRVEVYAYTGPANLTDDQIARLGARVGSVDVKAPRDPNATVDPGEPIGDVPPPEGPGLDQGAVATLREAIGASAMIAVELPLGRGRSALETGVVALAGPPPLPPTRFYVGVGITTRGRRGPFSARAEVPLVPPPAPVAAPALSYTESSIRVTWTPAADAALGPGLEASTDVLPARAIGLSQPSLAYNVYQLSAGAGPGLERSETRLTDAPVDEAQFNDSRIEWGAERCYAVRVARTVGGLTVESDLSPPACRTLVDTFPPKAPTGLLHIPSEGLVNLIWEPNGEKDLAGYLVLRGAARSGVLERVTPSPLQTTTFADKVPSGVGFIYAVQAVDRVGNISAESERIEETAR